LLLPPQFDSDFDFICQQYSESSCCSSAQRAALFVNFQLIQSAFGSA
jgi:hypothetical protein